MLRMLVMSFVLMVASVPAQAASGGTTVTRGYAGCVDLSPMADGVQFG